MDGRRNDLDMLDRGGRLRSPDPEARMPNLYGRLGYSGSSRGRITRQFDSLRHLGLSRHLYNAHEILSLFARASWARVVLLEQPQTIVSCVGKVKDQTQDPRLTVPVCPPP